MASASTASPLDNNHSENSDSTELLPWTLATALTCTRQLSKAINAHIVPIQYDKATDPITTPEQLMEEVTARVWNELAAQQGTKLTKVVGRTVLQYIWKDLDLTALQSTPEGASYCQTFYQLLMENKQTQNVTYTTSDAAALIWGGPQAVARRAADRQAAAAARVQEEQVNRLKQAVTTPMIEKVPEEEEEDSKPAAIE